MKIIGIPYSEGKELAKQVNAAIDDRFTAGYDSNTGLGIECSDQYEMFDTLTKLNDALRPLGLKIFGVYGGGLGNLSMSIIGLDEEE